MITQDIGRVKVGLNTTKVFTCSTGDSTGGAAINGSIVDRLALDRRYQSAEPFALAYSTFGSTAASVKTTLSVKLQHGDSSGGGDMADYSTGQQPSDAVFMSTAQTTPMDSWSTGTLQLASYPGVYDLRGAKRFVREVVTPSLSTGNFSQSTSTAGTDNLYVTGGIRFGMADEQPSRASTGPLSTSTSTST